MLWRNRRKTGMAKAYSDDLRRKLLEAHDDGEGTLEELAEQFHVSWGWASKISADRGKTGKMERQPGRKRGRRSKVTPEIQEFLKKAIQKKPDITLAELQLQLLEDHQLEICIGWLWGVLNRLDLRYKKNSTGGRTGLAKNPTAARGMAG